MVTISRLMKVRWWQCPRNDDEISFTWARKQISSGSRNISVEVSDVMTMAERHRPMLTTPMTEVSVLQPTKKSIESGMTMKQLKSRFAKK